jgi:hypothetical protein
MYVAAGTVDESRSSCQECGQGGVYPGEETTGVNGVGYSGAGGQVNFQMDGADHNDIYLNTSLPFPNPDAIEEFSAEYGNAGGGIVNIVTRSGTNSIHGSAFEFVRNGDLNARQFFAPVQDALKRNQFGGSGGGPIIKNKLFYFGTYQGTRLRNTPAGVVQFVPTPAERDGDFSAVSESLVNPISGQPLPDNQIPASLLSPVSQYFLNDIPLPNGPGGQLTFTGALVRQTEDQFMTKVDYVSGKSQISGSYFYTNFSAPPGQVATNILADASTGNGVRVQNVAINYTYTVSPTFLFNTTFGLNRQIGGSLSSAPFSFSDAGSNILGPQNSTLKQSPELVASVTSGFTINTNHYGEFNRGDYAFREVATKIIGRHEIKFGGEAIRVATNLTNTYQMSGNFSFSGQLSGNGLADFMLGEASAFTQGGGEFKDVRGTKWGFFVQDDLKVNQRLTLNLGLRWDPYLPFYDRQGRVLCFVPGAPESARYPNAPAGYLYGGDPGCPAAGYNADWRNLGPRAGFAYRLTQDGKTSIRSGAGFYYTPPTTGFNGVVDSAPFATAFTLNSVSFANPYGSVGLANPFPNNFGPRVPGPSFVFSPFSNIAAYFPLNYPIPQIISWSLRLEHQFRKDWVASAAYVGNKGTHLNLGLAENHAVYVPGASTVANTQARRVYPTDGTITLEDPGGNGEYEALQLNMEKRFGHSFSVLANYTRSKSLDNLSAYDPYTLASAHGLSSFDVPNNFKLSGLWEVPGPKSGLLNALFGGWQISPILTAQSGFPFTVTSGVDNSFTGVGSDHADYVGNGQSAQLSTSRPVAQQITQWFNTSVFTTNAVGTFGTAGRGILRGPKFLNTDMGIMKTFKLRERFNLQFRAEFFDIFNNVNFALPNSNRSSAQFGQITAVVQDNVEQLANSERIIQFGLKLSF